MISPETKRTVANLSRRDLILLILSKQSKAISAKNIIQIVGRLRPDLVTLPNKVQLVEGSIKDLVRTNDILVKTSYIGAGPNKHGYKVYSSKPAANSSSPVAAQ